MKLMKFTDVIILMPNIVVKNSTLKTGEAVFIILDQSQLPRCWAKRKRKENLRAKKLVPLLRKKMIFSIFFIDYFVLKLFYRKTISNARKNIRNRLDANHEERYSSKNFWINILSFIIEVGVKLKLKRLLIFQSKTHLLDLDPNHAEINLGKKFF